MSAFVSMRLLGGFSLAVQDKPVPLTSRKSVVLLARLALAPNHRIDRESLANFLWPGADNEHARISLRQALARLRRALGEGRDALQADNQTTWLDPGICRMDVSELRATGTVSGFGSELFGMFLDGYEFREPQIAEWLEAERRHLSEIALRRLRDARDAAIKRKAHADAIDYGLRIVAIDPYDEASHRSLMQTYAEDGRSARALRQYDLLKRLLENELGVLPDPETRSLYTQLRAAQSGAAHSETATMDADKSVEPASRADTTDALRLTTVLHATVLDDTAAPGLDTETRTAIEQDLGARVAAETHDGLTFVFDVDDATDAGVGMALEAGFRLLNDLQGAIALGCAAGLARRAGGAELRGAVFGRAQRLALTAGPGDIQVDNAVRQLGHVSGATEMRLSAGLHAWRLSRAHKVQRPPKPPFVGREAEFASFDEQIALACDGHGRILHYSGEAGIGKSRFCEEMMGRAVSRQIGVAHVVCRDNRTDSAPLKSRIANALASSPDVVERAMEDLEPEDQEVLTDLLHFDSPLDAAAAAPIERIPIAPLYASERDLERTVNTLAALVAARCADSPLLLVIEDCHRGGENGIAVLCAFAKTLAARPVLLLTTELLSGGRLRNALGAVTMDTPMSSSDLRPLSPTESQGLSEALLPGDPERARAIAERSHGNPLFLLNMVDAAPDQDGDMPSSILAMVQARLDRVRPETQHTCLRAALLGQQVRRAELEAIFPETRDALDLPQGLGHWFNDVFYFSHQLTQEAAYQLIPQEVARRLHLVAAQYFRRREPVRFAEHALRSGKPTLAAEACKNAANALLPQYRNDLAATYIEAGLAAAGLPDDSAELLYCRASMHREVGAYEAAYADYEAAEAAADSHRIRVQCMIRRCAVLKLRGQRAEASAILAKAERIAGDQDVGTDTLSELAQERGDLAFMQADAVACLEHNSRALRLAEQGGHILQRARALGGMGDAHYSGLRLQSAREAFRACVALAREHRMNVVDAAHRPMVGQTEFYVSPGEDALRIADDALRFARRAGSRRNEALALAVYSEILAYAVDVPRLTACLEEADQLVAAMGENRFEADFHFVRSLRAYGLRHDADATRLARNGLEQWPGSYLGPSFAGLLAAATDDASEREQAIEQGQHILARGGVSHTRLAFWHFASDAALRAGDPDRARAFADQIEETVTAEPVRFAHLSAKRSRAWADGDDAAREALAQELSEARLGLFAIADRKALSH